MIDVAVWMQEFLRKLDAAFGERVWFVGLQGSYGRGEATEESDIDTVVILDVLSASDIRRYGEMLDTLPHRDLICGFLSGKDEIMNWEPSDLFQFYHDTTPIVGRLDDLLARIDEDSIDRAIMTGVCNIYHGCVHNLLHEKSEDVLRGLYKSAAFVVQAIVYKQTGGYYKSHKDLCLAVSHDERTILDTFLSLRSGGAVDFDKMSENLFTWSKKYIENTRYHT